MCRPVRNQEESLGGCQTPKASCEIGMIQISFLHIMSSSGRIYSIIERCIHPKRPRYFDRAESTHVVRIEDAHTSMFTATP